jgi:hypothetical protein
MKELTELTKRIKKMLEGERKRRDIALSFLSFLKEELPEVCRKIYGESGKYESVPNPAVWVRKDGEKIYFRYSPLVEDREEIGFYYSIIENYRGEPIETFSWGRDFWYAIKTIIEWLPLLVKEIEKRELSRDKLVEKMKLFLEEG